MTRKPEQKVPLNPVSHDGAPSGENLLKRSLEAICSTPRAPAASSPMPGAALQKLVADSRDVPTAMLERARAAVRR
jgi:hypothetical protein